MNRDYTDEQLGEILSNLPRDKTWDYLVCMTTRIARKHSGSIRDKRAGRSWDPGQAICAEEFGPDWMNNPEFQRREQLPDSVPAYPSTISAANRVLRGECDWMEGGDE